MYINLKYEVGNSVVELVDVESIEKLKEVKEDLDDIFLTKGVEGVYSSPTLGDGMLYQEAVAINPKVKEYVDEDGKGVYWVIKTKSPMFSVDGQYLYAFVYDLEGYNETADTLKELLKSAGINYDPDPVFEKKTGDLREPIALGGEGIIFDEKSSKELIEDLF